ncbi:polysaccharide biosynthesis/export family protein [Algibacter mikhailovii]|uniref:polysaccharide biosynthesis/export family protein n=1 Tax=Algibacter mikhailovii TaxID=425498 RepID=UPI0024951955|nr:polysaccharide biosynthesis/export family protein [Algibacter mikhailovii]
MKTKHIQLFTLLGVLLLLSNCASSKKIEYFQEVEGLVISDSISDFAAQIKTGDLLYINVTATNAEAAIPFNLYETPILSNSVANARPIAYLVDDDGRINFPVLGKLDIAGFTTKQLTKVLEDQLIEYITDPTINIRFANFRVSVLGEVKTPGAYPVSNERLSVIEAISLAGDLTIYGKRESVLLIRIEDGKKEFITLDLTNKKLFDSPYYNLKQNDVIYVPPNKTRVNSSAIGPNTSVIISSISLLIALLAIIIR